MTETLIPAAPEVVTPERVTPLRPSEALRLGRLTVPMRIEGTYFDGAFGACAVGAIAVGMGFEATRDGDGVRTVEAIIKAKATGAQCPECDHRWVGASHLNDTHHWSDDQIVAWLQSLGL